MADAGPATDRPSVLIIGGLGYIGRFLAKYLHENDLASEIRIVDKQLPELAWLAPEFKDVCTTERFVQADMSREATADKLLSRADGSAYDYVFNCGGDTRYNQDDEIYRQRSLKLSVTVATVAAKRGVKCFVELSTGHIYKGDKEPSKENSKTKPWTKLAKWKLEAEGQLEKIEGLNLVILRMPYVYGEYNSQILGTLLCVARVYAYLGENMRFLFTKEQRTHSLHVNDAARAMWTAAEWYTHGKKNWNSSWGKTPVFNVVDESDMSQGLAREVIAKIFGIKTGFYGTIITQLAKLNMHSAVDEENEEILQPWGELLNQHGITRPGPISPYIDLELMQDQHLSMDGTRFKTVTGFKYEVPKVNEQQMRAIINSYRRMGWWPDMALTGEEGGATTIPPPENGDDEASAAS